MANFSITVTNALFFEGPSYPTIWNAFTWGQENWGNVRYLGTDVTHAVDTSLTLDSSFNFSYIKPILESLDLVSEAAKYVTITLNNTLTFLIDMGSETLRDGNGWYYVFPDDITELEGRAFTTWTVNSGNSASWVASSSASTTWSEET
mgnify:CR=1 FL=1